MRSDRLGYGMARDDAAIRIDNFRLQRKCLSGVEFVYEVCAHANRRGVATNVRSSDKRAPGPDMQSVREQKPHVSKNSGPGIKPRIGVARMIYTHSDHVVVTKLNQFGEINLKAAVAIRALVDKLTVEPNFGVI